MSTPTRIGLTLTPDQYAALEAQADQWETTITEAARLILARYLEIPTPTATTRRKAYNYRNGGACPECGVVRRNLGVHRRSAHGIAAGAA
jgi:hypothetical protein